MRALLMASVLAACSQAPAPAITETETAAAAIPAGSFNAYGDSPAFEFIVDTAAQAMELRMEYETIASAPYAPPQPHGDGAQIVSGDLTVDITPAACTEGGREYPLSITIQVVGRQALSGCAVERWDTHLVALMPYIDACVAKSPNTRQVSYAGGADTITVRMRGQDAEQDCTVQRSDPASAVAQQRSESLAIAGESAAIFVRGPGENPGGECFEAPEVRGADGELLGWMLDPMGC